MASLEYPASSTSGGRTVTVKFVYPINASSPTPEIVQVTGTFNDWERTEPLTRNLETSRFEGDILISLDNTAATTPSNKVLYKFVLDGSNWVTDPSQETDRDQAGNLNNVIFINTARSSSPINGHEDQQYTRDGSTTTAAAAAAVNEDSIDEDEEEVDEEEQRLAQLKREAEDDATIRQLGGGMWGAPFFAVNDPPNLPEHFVNDSNRDLTDDTPLEEPSIETAPVVAPIEEQPQVEVEAETTEEVKAEQKDNQVKEEYEGEDEDDKIIRELGGTMWGTPYFKVNDSVQLPEHFTEVLGASNPEDDNADAEVSVVDKNATTPLPESLYEGEVLKDEVNVSMNGTLLETVVETTEDTVIEAPDGTFLEESITTSVQETLSGQVEETVSEVIETIEEIEPATPTIATTAEDSTPEVTMTETESTTAIQGEDGVETLVVEDTLTFSEDSGIDSAPTAAAVEEPVVIQQEEASAAATEVAMTETEATTSIQGENGLATTVVENTITFTDGPEVNSNSLHKLTTAIKPVLRGESLIVEQSPEVNVIVSLPEPFKATAGYKLPLIDVISLYTQLNDSSKSKIGINNDGHNSDSVVLLQGQPIITSSPSDPPAPSHLAFTGDEKKPSRLSVSQRISIATNESSDTVFTPTSVTSTASTAISQPTEKHERRKSFWKKIKKVLS
ncbi:hypothetical protein BGX26_002862 [Mortierella sp. AD094]|nr:hypothetical protein BGX26_002862 [Mortierella sp. AD094]